MRIPEHKVDEIYQAIDIVDIVSDYLPLKKKGQNYWALSPFTTEKTPSFAVSPAKNIYKCFSSGKGGNGVNFLIEMEGYTYVEALVHVAKKYGIDVQVEESKEDEEVRDKRQSLYIVNEFAADFFHDQLLDSDEGRKIGRAYFKERGILETTIKEYKLGYAPEGWEVLSEAAVSKQYKEEFLLDLGLSFKSDKTGRLIDRFRGRVMFPITNTVGKVVGFGGRILKSDAKAAKYINSSESEIYHKSKVLFGLSLSKQHIRNADECILTEGYMDTIALYQNGIRNVVASSGTALTTDQVRLIRRFTRQVLIVYDGDPAGIKAASRAIDTLLAEEMEPRVLLLPEGHDPDSYLKAHGAGAFNEYKKNEALSFIDFKLNVLTADGDTNDPAATARLIRALAPTLASIQDRIQKELYVKYTAERLGISESLMAEGVFEAARELHKLKEREIKREKRDREAEVKELKSFEQLDLVRQEKELLRILLNYYDRSFPEEEGVEDAEDVALLEFFDHELEGLAFENQIFENLKNDILGTHASGKAFDINPYLNHEDQSICNLVSEMLTIPYVISDNWRKYDVLVKGLDDDLGRSVRAAIYYYKKEKVKKLLKENQGHIKEVKEEEELDQLLKVRLHLESLRVEISQRLGIIIDGN